jgi:DNA repair protein RadA/Sms
VPKNNLNFVCQSCGATYKKWQGKCDACGEWNTLAEEIAEVSSSKKSLSINANDYLIDLKKASLSNTSFSRFSTGVGELDRCLGIEKDGQCGMVMGSVVLIGGQPGIGKSTLLTQVVAHVARDVAKEKNKQVLYVCGEESPAQINLRLKRVLGENKNWEDLPINYVTTTNVDIVTEIVKDKKPSILIIDSVQTLSTKDLQGPAGSIGQIKESADRITNCVKEFNIPTFLVGHVTKDGDIAGPKILEHIVDAIMELSGERSSDLRLLRSLKNRFGPTDEVGVFRMIENGMEEVANPSGYFLEQAVQSVPGSAIVCVMEGSRPLLTEVQALVVNSQLAMPRRVGRGVELSRIQVLAAVLQKHCGLPLGMMDIFLSTVGGFNVRESAIDLGLAIALASSTFNKQVPKNSVFIGEVGLMGEIRAVSNLERRLKEVKRLGYENVYSRQTHTNLKSLFKDLGFSDKVGKVKKLTISL